MPFLQVVKTTVATLLAWLIAAAVFPGTLPIFAAIAALIVVQPSVNQSFGKAIERSVGVILGVLVATIIGAIFGTGDWIVLLTVVVAILIAWVLRLGPGSASQIPISAMLVLAIGAGKPDYAVERIIETIIGAAIGLVVNVLIVPPVLVEPANRAIAQLTANSALVIDQLADALTTPQSPGQLEQLLTDARALRDERDAAAGAVAQATDSLTLNPRSARHRVTLHHDEEFLLLLSGIITREIGMVRAVHDHYDDGLRTEPTVRAIAVELTRAAHDLRLRADEIGRDPSASPTRAAHTAELPALTAPLTVAKPHPDHWILIGSLLEDLRRIREEIVGE